MKRLTKRRIISIITAFTMLVSVFSSYISPNVVYAQEELESISLEDFLIDDVSPSDDEDILISKDEDTPKLDEGNILLSNDEELPEETNEDLITDSDVEEAPVISENFELEEGVLFFDNFDNNYDRWDSYEGSWALSDGALTVSRHNGAKVVANDTNYTNFIYEADVKLSDTGNNGNAGLIFRVSDPSNGGDNLRGYYAGIVNTDGQGLIQIGRFNNNWTELSKAPFDIEPDRWYKITVAATDNIFEVYVDDTYVLTFADSIYKSGSIGLRTFEAAAAFDNATVYEHFYTLPENSFTNPIVQVASAMGTADPWVIFKDGYYYYCKSDADSAIQVAKAERLQDIGIVPRVTVWTPPDGEMYSKGLWAPELHFVDGKWYVYVAADNGHNENHRMYVLESVTDDAQGEYIFKGKITDSTDKWAIDGTVFEGDDGQLYFIWSGWEGDTDIETGQITYIAKMSNPWTISSERVELSRPTEPWEKIGEPPAINEGAQILRKNDKVHIVYSASGSWTEDYCLGILTNTDGNYMNPSSWEKTGPVFSKAPGAYSTGHASFTISPDGEEDWIVYHATETAGGGWGQRSARAQKFTWDENDMPVFPRPVPAWTWVTEPSGTPEKDVYKYEAEDARIGGPNARVVKDDRDTPKFNASAKMVAGYIDSVSDYVEFDVNVKSKGKYVLGIMASNGTDYASTHTVTVNGTVVGEASYVNRGWNVFNPTHLLVNLRAGYNTIKLNHKDNFAEIDYIVLYQDDEASEDLEDLPSAAAMVQLVQSDSIADEDLNRVASVVIENQIDAAKLEDLRNKDLLLAVDGARGNNITKNAVMFPHNIGLGAITAGDVDSEVVAKIGEAAGKELAALNIPWVIAPSVKTTTNIREQNTFENFGATDNIVSNTAIPYIEGLQNSGIIATAKNYTGNDYGLDVIVTSDFTAIKNADPTKFIVAVINDSSNLSEVKDALDSGAHMVRLNDGDVDSFTKSAAKAGFTEENVEAAINKINVFKEEIENISLSEGVIGSADSKKAAREAVRNSLVLLKNEDKIVNKLVNDDVKNVLVAGVAANNIGMQSGPYTLTRAGEVDSSGQKVTAGTTLLEGFRMAARTKSFTYSSSGILPSTIKSSTFQTAIVVVRGEGNSINPADVNVLNNVTKLGIKTIVITLSGAPVDISDYLSDVKGLVAAWYPGTEGAGVGDVLFNSEYDFDGRLPVSWPWYASQPNDELFAVESGLSKLDSEELASDVTNPPEIVNAILSKDAPATVYAIDFKESFETANVDVNNTASVVNKALKFNTQGSYADYEIEVNSAGTYKLDFNLLNLIDKPNGMIVLVDNEIAAHVAVPSTGVNWNSSTNADVYFTVGRHVIRIYAAQTEWSLHNIKFTHVDDSGSIPSLVTTIDTETVTSITPSSFVDFSVGKDGIKLENNHLTSFSKGKWATYKVNITEAGTYKISLAYSRSGSADGTNAVLIDINGRNAATLNMSAQSLESSTIVTFDAGIHEIKIQSQLDDETLSLREIKFNSEKDISPEVSARVLLKNSNSVINRLSEARMRNILVFGSAASKDTALFRSFTDAAPSKIFDFAEGNKLPNNKKPANYDATIVVIRGNGSSNEMAEIRDIDKLVLNSDDLSRLRKAGVPIIVLLISQGAVEVVSADNKFVDLYDWNGFVYVNEEGSRDIADLLFKADDFTDKLTFNWYWYATQVGNSEDTLGYLFKFGVGLTKSDTGIATDNNRLPVNKPNKPEGEEPEPSSLRNGLRADYYTVGNSSPWNFLELKSTVVDNQISFADMEGILMERTGQNDHAGTIWSGKVIPKTSGNYTFSVYSDNGARLYIDDVRVTDYWDGNRWDNEQFTSPMYLYAGEEYQIKLEYFEHVGGSHVTLYWNNGDGKVPVPADVLYLNDDFEASVITKVDLSEAVLKEGEISGNAKLTVLGLTETTKIRLVRSSGDIVVDDLDTSNRAGNIITIEIPKNLKAGAYRFVAVDNNIIAPYINLFAVTLDSIREEYPLPTWERSELWISLNGPWDFKFDPTKVGETSQWYKSEIKDQTIFVPFPWEAPLSGIVNTSYRGTAWYQRDLVLDENWEGKQVVLKFGAVDWMSSLWVNGEKVGDNVGGYTPFEFDITDFVTIGANNKITLMVNDEASYGDHSYTALIGKQGHNAPCGYTHTSGIWQSVIVEARNSKTQLGYARIDPLIDTSSARFNMNVISDNDTIRSLTLKYNFESVLWNDDTLENVKTGSNFSGSQEIVISRVGDNIASFVVSIPEQKLWEPDEPNLYDGVIELYYGDVLIDRVKTYFGQRKISRAVYHEGTDYEYIYLNNKPVFISGLLDQGFWEEGVYTAPTEEALKFDISSMRSIGFNLIRKHLKIEDPLQYLWCDRLGMMVWADMPHATNMNYSNGENGTGRVVFEDALRDMIARDYNNPSLISYILFNETWGITHNTNTNNWMKEMYYLTKEMDTSGRLTEDMSPCNFDHIQPTDLNTFHMYPTSYADAKSFVDDRDVRTYVGSQDNFLQGYVQDGDPWLNSEYGGVAAYSGDHDVSWCFKYQTDIQRLRQKLNGFVYTEPYDIEYECNGILNYDRTWKIFGYEEIAYGGDMSINYLTQTDYIGIDKDPMVTLSQGGTYAASVGMIRWSDYEIENPILKWRFDATDVYGNKIDTGIFGQTAINYVPYTYETKQISFTIPNDSAFAKIAGTVTVWIEDNTGKIIAKNFSNLKTTDGKTTKAIDNFAEGSYALRQTTQAFNQFTNGVGAITYEYNVPEEFNVAELNNMRILAELSSIKPTDSQTAVGEEKPSDVTVSINGHEVDAIFIPDAPRDMRGTLSLNSGLPSAKEFGYLVNINLSNSLIQTLKAELENNKTLTVKYEVKSNAVNKNGIKAYNENVGRYAVSPMIILNPTEEFTASQLTLSQTPVTIYTASSNNYSVESDVTGNVIINAGYEVVVDGNSVTVSEAGNVIAQANSKEAVSHIKVTFFDRQVRVYTNNDPEFVIDVYGEDFADTAVVVTGNGELREVVVVPETYKNTAEAAIEREIQFVESFEQPNKLDRWVFMGTQASMDGSIEGSFEYAEVTGKNDSGHVEFTARAGHKIVNYDVVGSNIVAEGDFTITGETGSNVNGNVGFIIRGSEFTETTDGANGYYIGIGYNNGGFVEVGRMNQNWVSLKKVSAPIIQNETVRLKVVAVGPRIMVYLNDNKTPYIDVYDSTYSNGAIAIRGFRCSGTLDNIVVSTAPRYNSDFEDRTNATSNYTDARFDEWSVTGDWSINNGKFVTSGDSTAFVGSDAWSDYEMSVDVNSSNAVSGLILRAIETNRLLNGYYAVVDSINSDLILGKITNGSNSVIKAVDIDVVENGKLRVVASNNLIKVYYNDSESSLIREVDSSYFYGRVGLISISGDTSFDNFIVSDKYLFEDHFYDGSLDGWKNIKGDWSVADNILSVDIGTDDKLIDGYATMGDFQLDFDFRLNDGEASANKYNAGVVFRATDFSAAQDNLRGYVLGLNHSRDSEREPSGLELGDIHYGWRWIDTARTDVLNNTWYHLTLRCEGNNIKAYIDDELLLDVTDDQYTHGQIALRNYRAAASYKNIVIIPLGEDVIIDPEEPVDPDPEDPPLRNGIRADYYTVSPNPPWDFVELKSTVVNNQINFSNMDPILSERTGQDNNAGVIWSGKIIPKISGNYVFSTFSDNGTRLYIDGERIINYWDANSWDQEQFAPSMYLQEGKEYDFRLDYFDHVGGSHVRLYWNDGSGKVLVPSDVFYLKDDFNPVIIKDLTMIDANLEEGNIQGSIHMSLFGMTENTNFNIVTVMGDMVDVDVNVIERTEDTVKIEIPKSLTANAYKILVEDNSIMTQSADPFIITRHELRSEYPRPDWDRSDNVWMNLNGLWDFKFDQAKVGESEQWFKSDIKDLKILVPFPWEAPLSGVVRPDYLGTAWYQRDLVLDQSWNNKRVIIKFGAVDWMCSLWVNGEKVGDNIGGYTPFEFDITDYVTIGENNKITLMANDEASYGDHRYTALVGKQGHNAPCGYTHTSGIWQPVILEGRNSKTHIDYANVDPLVDTSSVRFNMNIIGESDETRTLTLNYNFESVLWDKEGLESTKTGSNFDFSREIVISKAGDNKASFVFDIPNQKLWSPDEPNIYEGTVELYDGDVLLDRVKTYFGQRKISIDTYHTGKDFKYVYLNDKPIYFSGLLDQGFWEEGIYTAPSEEALKFDITSMRALDFNLIRKHLKIEEPLQYVWADRLGMMVWADMPHATNMNDGDAQPNAGRVVYEEALTDMIKRDYNKPSLIAYILFNETWGIDHNAATTTNWIKEMYYLTKELDTSGRLTEDMSQCWNDHIQPTDLNTWHAYPTSYASAKAEYDLKDERTYPGSSNDFLYPYVQDGDPWINSEYGGVAAYSGDHDVSWCFKYQTDILRLREKLNGFVYTEPYDIEYECNGILNYDRSYKIFG